VLPHVPRKAIAGLTTLAAAGALAASASPAAPAAPSKCYTKPGRPAAEHFCPLWKASMIPVYATPSLRDRVGFLTVGGSANWFIDQVRGEIATGPRPNYRNEWWAYTLADISDERGKPAPMGYVPEIYFRGGGAVTRDPALGLPVRRASGQRPD
jgi:hypothetical protein